MEGKKAYSQHMWLLRFHSSLFFSRCEVNAVHMTCSDQPQAMQASVRLRMQRLWGIPLHNLIEDPLAEHAAYFVACMSGVPYISESLLSACKAC